MHITRPDRTALLSLVVSASTLLFLCAGCGSSGTKKTPTTPVVNHVAGADCGGCHTAEHQNWAMTLHAAPPAEVLLNTEHNTAELLTDECIGCHAPFQAAGHHIGDFVQPVDQTGPWNLVAGSDSTWQAIKCEVCHDPTSNTPKKLAFHDPVTQTYVAVSDVTELCEKCHQAGTDDSRDLAGSVHQGIQCSACHNQAGSQMRLDPHGSCSQCHPHVNPSHPDVTQLDTTYLSGDSPNNIHFITCTTCHASPGVTQPGSPEARHP